MRASSLTGRLVLGSFLVFLAGIVTLINYSRQRDLFELVREGARAQARVSGLNCGNHGEIFYAFQAETKTFVGSGHNCGLPCSTSSLGESLEIVYAPKNPNNSQCSLDSYRNAILTAYAFIFGAVVWLAVAICRITKVGAGDVP